MAEKKSQVSQDDKLFGALAYVSCISILMFLVKKEDKFVAHHAKQGIVLFVGSLFWAILPPLGTATSVVSYIMMVIGFLKAYKGEWYEMPVVSAITKKLS